MKFEQSDRANTKDSAIRKFRTPVQKLHIARVASQHQQTEWWKKDFIFRSHPKPESTKDKSQAEVTNDIILKDNHEQGD